MESVEDVLRPIDRNSNQPNDGLSEFLNARRYLLRVASRILRDTNEAEDVVQDVWFRWQSTSREKVLDPLSFLVTTTTRLCINILHSARSRREVYVDSWLFEPADNHADPRKQAERDEAVESSLRGVFQTLGPIERAAYVLREAFDYTYRQIAIVFNMNEANARKIVARAREKISTRYRTTSSPKQDRFVEAFFNASRTGDSLTLERFLILDVATVRGPNVRSARALTKHCPRPKRSTPTYRFKQNFDLSKLNSSRIPVSASKAIVSAPPMAVQEYAVADSGMMVA